MTAVLPAAPGRERPTTPLTLVPPPAGPDAGPARRVAFYSHDTQGLGHTRRNIVLAAALVAARPDTDVLLLTGNPEAAVLPLPPRTDVLTLPTVGKTPTGSYAPRVLGTPLEVVLDLRARILEAALGSFAPDLLVVDKVPGGVHGELLPALRTLRALGGTRVVLGLREVLDRPEVAVREWRDAGTTEVLAEHYDEVWVYGDPAVYDPVAEYGLPPEVAALVRYTGYLGHARTDGVRPRTRPGRRSRPPAGPYVLCTVGGGQDGQALAEAFAAARLPEGHRGVLLTGPFMAPAARRAVAAAAAGNDRLRIVDFVPDADAFVAGAAAVVSMAGYNSVCELLAARARTLLVPRVRPREEQLVRAERLAGRGLLDCLHPDRLSPASLTDWMATAVSTPAPPAEPVDLDGLRRVPRLADALLAAPAAALGGARRVA
ncbi:glycosyltransferase family protein [Geodermatophilus sp. DSM 44513]|uniref:glycosyltransferase family protein n=1 Tax=Geodermatophilus sp. DSM 44513 TaxID=1528104 RepID=UPI001285343C|nr:glycosyltransferase [Geodermatophilus sp. DSM 44513]WNV76027.1 glycosyltransferase [Geodermatophilus sp. DSM 44513]